MVRPNFEQKFYFTVYIHSHSSLGYSGGIRGVFYQNAVLYLLLVDSFLNVKETNLYFLFVFVYFLFFAGQGIL